MLAHMPRQTRCLGIGIPAELAHKLFLLSVQELVMVEALLAGECCAAHLAHMRTLCGVHGHMLAQSRMGGESLIAYLAPEGTFTRVRAGMDTQCLLVAATVAATLADEVLLLRMHLDVVTHVPCGEESLLTARMIALHIALVRVLQLVAL